MQCSSRNCSSAPDFVFLKLIFPHVLFSGGLFFHRHRYVNDIIPHYAAPSVASQTLSPREPLAESCSQRVVGFVRDTLSRGPSQKNKKNIAISIDKTMIQSMITDKIEGPS